LAMPPTFRLDPDTRVRGMQEVKEPTVIVPSGQSLVALELSVGGRNSQTYRAKLESMLENRTILEENELHAMQVAGSSRVVVPVPTAFLEEKKHYVVVLESLYEKGDMPAVRRFTFYIAKK